MNWIVIGLNFLPNVIFEMTFVDLTLYKFKILIQLKSSTLKLYTEQKEEDQGLVRVRATIQDETTGIYQEDGPQ